MTTEPPPDKAAAKPKAKAPKPAPKATALEMAAEPPAEVELADSWSSFVGSLRGVATSLLGLVTAASTDKGKAVIDKVLAPFEEGDKPKPVKSAKAVKRKAP